MKTLNKILIAVSLASILIIFFLGGLFKGASMGQATCMPCDCGGAGIKNINKNTNLSSDSVKTKIQNILDNFNIVEKIENDNWAIYLAGKEEECGLYLGTCYLIAENKENKMDSLKFLTTTELSIGDLKIIKTVFKSLYLENTYYDKYFLEYTESFGDGPMNTYEEKRIDLSSGEIQTTLSNYCGPDLDETGQNEIRKCTKTIYFYNENIEEGNYEFVKKCTCSYDKEKQNDCICN